MGSNRRYAHYYDRMTEERMIESFIAKAGPLQSLTPEEIELDALPLTIYPEGRRPQVKAWVRFGPKHARVDAVIVRSNSLAAGIEFTVRGKTYRCWVWGNATQMSE
ncbi:hypothetical protein [Microbacterium sp. NPDC058345]|uniref:hypothetical protein n=1 Tax=Microbacterium sp. NPDC058345 TaxID=3346455 RepID=UPI003648B7FF